VPDRQLHLLEPIKPLLERLGPEFFRAAPRQPGVYIMTGKSERVLYIGQSGNLRTRLGSYKNARRDRAPRKIVRLAHLVESITYETCASAEAAIRRESELLLLHRPKFNSAGVFPKQPKYIGVESNEHGMEMRLKVGPPQPNSFGPFKGDALASFGALCRTIWTVLYEVNRLENFPIRLLTPRPERHVTFGFHDPTIYVKATAIRPALDHYLRGQSDELLTLLTTSLPPSDLLCAFQQALHARDLETLKDFYLRGTGNKNGRQILNPTPVL
jgi:predicted GIY-YIG superfamily endonuclease